MCQCSVLTTFSGQTRGIHHVAIEDKWRRWLQMAASEIWKIINKRRFWVRPTLSKRKILTYTSLSYSTFEVLNSCPLHNAKGPHRLQVVKPENKTETFRSSPTGDGARQSWRKHKQVAEMFHKCCRIVADLSQNTEFLFCRFSVDPAVQNTHKT